MGLISLQLSKNALGQSDTVRCISNWKSQAIGELLANSTEYHY